MTAYTEGEVGHTVRELESLGLVREAWGARVAKYEHLAGKVLGLQSKGLALLCPMMLRGPQTPGELKTNAHRLFEFDDLDDVQFVLQRLAEHEPPLVMALPRQPGQKEVRYVHLLGGEPDPADYESAPAAWTPWNWPWSCCRKNWPSSNPGWRQTRTSTSPEPVQETFLATPLFRLALHPYV